MPLAFLIPSLMSALATITASLVGRVLLALSISFVVYTGFEVAGTAFLDQIKGNFSGMPAEAVGLLGYLWVDKAINIIFSGYTAALAVKMAGSSTITRMVTK